MINRPQNPEEIDLFLDEQRLFNLRQCIEAQGTALRILLDEDELKIFLLYIDYMKELVKLERKISFEKGCNSAKKELSSSTHTT